jgi:DNA repair protein RadA/Sms
MSKAKTYFSCSECTYQSKKWLGCCPQCNKWNTLKEQNNTPTVTSAQTCTMHSLSTISTEPPKRMSSGIQEWDRVMGGGLIPGSFVMLTGDPGIGKSTLLLQATHQLAQTHSVLYFSSEESLEQVKHRAVRLNCVSNALLFSDKANLEEIITTAQQRQPDIVVIDSIQNCYSSNTQTFPGSVGQLRESAFQLMSFAKKHNIAVLLTGHITKEGSMAGPKTLEHMVDATFYLQGEDRWQTRVLRAVKNRFGTVNEVGFFEMEESGLQEVPNINQNLLEETSQRPGSILSSYIEGTRPLLLELQALTVQTQYTQPQRVISGIDHKQVMLIAAILEKYLKIKLNSYDIFFKISGNFKIKDNTADLGIALALLSSFLQQPLPEKCLALGEISLSGQIKPINQLQAHLQEIQKFGISKLFVARNQKIAKTTCSKQSFDSVYELLTLFE